jgi:6-pyruvoyltetrahydropterin/6-carboxytetrahydropterin synthase
MGHYLLSVEAGFSAAHTLPGVAMCDRFHGHNWRVRLSVRVEEEALHQSGMGVDFRIVRDIVEESVSDFEHSYLNDLKEFQEHPPSAERIAKVVCERAGSRLASRAPNATVVEVEVAELPEFRAIYRP